MPDPVRWVPDNPHPLSLMRTELVWDGKYDEYHPRDQSFYSRQESNLKRTLIEND